MKYSKEIVEKICNLVVSGDYTVNEICRHVVISRAIYFRWKTEKIDFSDKIKAANEQRLDSFKKPARSGLLVLLNGKEYEEVTKEYAEGKSGKPGKAAEPKLKSIKKVKKFILPNLKAVLSTLKSLDRENFSGLIEIDHIRKDKTVHKNFYGFVNTGKSDLPGPN